MIDFNFVLLFLGLIIQKDRFEFPPSLFFIQLISYAAYVYIQKNSKNKRQISAALMLIISFLYSPANLLALLLLFSYYYLSLPTSPEIERFWLYNCARLRLFFPHFILFLNGVTVINPAAALQSFCRAQHGRGKRPPLVSFYGQAALCMGRIRFSCCI